MPAFDEWPVTALSRHSLAAARGSNAPKPVVPKIVFGPWARAVPNVCLGDQRDARLFKIG
jgi:hypothetical protein